jgi:selenocysteine-specific elongation factor
MSAGTPLVLGTAGHVDHGKTALVLALTGRDTDRLPEEKARGISIALGFAPLELDADRAVSLVDVPGHERFVRHMVAGASGVDGYLMCVAADDGVMPQTVEHMAVLRLLGVTEGVVAVTKSDLIEPELAIDEARELVGDGPEIVAVSALTGEGISDLRAALARLVTRLERRTAWGRPRLFVDRVFSVAGAGTVVTGTLWGGAMTTGDRVQIVPGTGETRIRAVQAHDVSVDVASGGRVALNLVGIERDEAPRGACVVRSGDGWEPTTRLDVELTWLADAGGPLRSRRRLQVFLGTAEVGATCVLLDRNELAPGEVGYAQLRLDMAVPAVAADRLVLRSAERRTVGGARVVDPAPQRHGKGSGAAERLVLMDRGNDDQLALLDLARSGRRGIRIDLEHAQRIGAAVLDGGWAIPGELAETAVRSLRAAIGQGIDVAAARAATGLDGPVADALIATQERLGQLQREGPRVVPPERAGDAAAPAVAALLADAGRRPPGIVELSETTGLDPRRLTAILAELRTAGSIVAAGDLWFDARIADDAIETARQVLADGPKGIGELRDAWGVGRRHALALAAHLDAVGVTRRIGDSRVLRRGAATG